MDVDLVGAGTQTMIRLLGRLQHDWDTKSQLYSVLHFQCYTFSLLRGAASSVGK